MRLHWPERHGVPGKSPRESWVLDVARPNPIPGKSVHVYGFHRYWFPICHLLEADLWKPVPIKSTDVVYRDLMGTGFPDLVDDS